ncbi:3-oxo-5-alpha-steroid 4-dehydrogenase-domain-containing protein [Abortiporus biennis]|nr:3-oxo-5-alpha-steroid 4-dehydrogenase-domain-containing protein [Abortiporus biennis]
MVSVTVSQARRVPVVPKGFPITVEIPDKTAESATVADVKAAVAAKFPIFYVERQAYTVKGEKKTLADETTLNAAGIAEGGELVVKDLGPQIGWQTVFLIEYVGPLIVHPLIYHFPSLFYGGSVQHSLLQKYVYIMVLLHFVKRELETLFVHRFSHGTMPLYGVFRNSFHYHVLGGLGLAYSVYSPTFSATSPYIRGTIRNSPTFLWSWIAIWAFAEISNWRTHVILRNLRPAGTKVRKIPYGYGFDLVSCPNYAFEILGWTVISVMTNSYASHVFLIAAVYIEVVWALKKHRNYKKEFGTAYPKGRKAIFPFII